MRFEERNLQPFAEPVSAAELREGVEYFSVIYSPEDMTIPFMETLRFVGRNLEAEDVGVVYFQEVGPYRPRMRSHVGVRDPDLEPFPREENQLSATFEFERALDGLLRCSLRRRKLDSQGPMRFDARELATDAETIPPTELQDGSVYFGLEYADNERLVPVMDTVVFIGRNLETGDKGALYFQDFDSYAEGVRYHSVDKPDWATFQIASEDEPPCTFEFEKALEELMRCSLRRRKVEA